MRAVGDDADEVGDLHALIDAQAASRIQEVELADEDMVRQLQSGLALDAGAGRNPRVRQDLALRAALTKQHAIKQQPPELAAPAVQHSPHASPRSRMGGNFCQVASFQKK